MPFEGVKVGPPPPKEGVRRPAPEKRVTGRQKAREEAANGIGQLIGFGFMVTGQLADAGAVGMHWPAIAHELASVAETDEKMGKALDYLLEVGPYGNLIVVALPFIGQLLVNHKIVKPEALAGANVVPPEALEASMHAQMAETKMHAIRVRQEAEEQLARMQAEMAAQTNGQTPHD